MKIYSFLILFILLIPNALAWNSYYHKSLAEKAYYSLDFETQEKLNLSMIQYGATTPDLVFHDVVKHHYPPSYYLAERWLESAKSNYSLGNYNEASYSFGIASHYITDSFVSPHYISKEPGSLHSQFENIDKKYKFKSKCSSFKYNLNQTLYHGSLNKKDWTSWLLTKEQEIPKKELEQALTALYPIAQETFNSSCNNFETEVVKRKFSLLNFLDIFK
ncbi:MAG: zinc dependent phospholipase C family protein [Nanoarchaeota archaeon]